MDQRGLSPLVHENKIPPEFKKLILSVFPDVEFSSHALFELLRGNFEQRAYDVLTTINFKLTPTPGMRVQPFMGLRKDNVWEYRFSQEGRILVEYRKGSKPLIILVDYFHNHW